MDLRSSKESDNLILQLISPKNDKGGNPPRGCKLWLEKAPTLQSMGDEMSHGNKGNNKMSIQELIPMGFFMRTLNLQPFGYVAKLVKSLQTMIL
jgi:hypothetical protein